MGKVSKGLSIEEIKKIPKKKYYKSPNKPEEMYRFFFWIYKNNKKRCSICYCEFETGTKIRKLYCNHDYHSKCIKKWLLNEKTCPICKKEVETS